METHIIVQLVIVGILVGCWLLLVIWTYCYVTAKFKILFEPLDEGNLATAVRNALTAENIDPTWLSDFGFEPVGGYRIVFSRKTPSDTTQAPTIVIWKLSGESNYLFITQFAEAQIEFHTPLKDGSLTTSSAKHSLVMVPEPGIWRQTFPSLGVPALYELHLDALAYIEQELGQPRGAAPAEPTDLARSAIFGDIESVRRQPFWPLRIPYWTFLALRERRSNKTIREQVE